MMTKLTLRLEQRAIEKAKSYARQRNKSLSQLVEEYFVLLTKVDEPRANDLYSQLPPITRSLYGLLRDTTVNEQDYKDYLESKYL
jgi:hypothetical protein